LDERSATALGSSDHHPALNIASKDKYHIDSSRGGNECEDQDLLATTEQNKRASKPAKRVASHAISQHELSSLGITPSDSHGQKVESAYGHDHNVDERDDGADNAATSQPQTPHRCAPAGPAKKPRLLINSDPFTPSPPGSPSPSSGAENDQDDDGDEEEEASDFDSPSPPRKKKTTAKKTSASTTRRPVKARKARKAKNATSSAASKRSASAKNRNYVFPVANTLSEASEADRMMFRMKGEGKSWKEITAEWSRMTGRQPGSSSLSVRYIKLKEKFARMGDPDVS
jgi:hypothetical protein